LPELAEGSPEFLVRDDLNFLRGRDCATAPVFMDDPEQAHVIALKNLGGAHHWILRQQTFSVGHGPDGAEAKTINGEGYAESEDLHIDRTKFDIHRPGGREELSSSAGQHETRRLDASHIGL